MYKLTYEIKGVANMTSGDFISEKLAMLTLHSWVKTLAREAIEVPGTVGTVTLTKDGVIINKIIIDATI